MLLCSLAWGAMAEPLAPARTPCTSSPKPAWFSPKDARHRPCAPSTPLLSPNSSRGDPQTQSAPQNSHDTRQPPHLCLSSPPSRVLPAPHYSPSLSEEVRSKARENAFARSLPSPALSLKQKRREEGGGWGGGRKVRREMGTTVRGAGEGGRNGERREGPGPRSRAAWRGRSLTCPGRCRC